ncbi:hypothetical protein [Lacipirellula parvula]|uniref:Uncharacterized protein n=1 Tax=Lacipirellula parvula TaxID=2650471 RepID=A0A5K7XHK0_9BACT|nr:hypothetical protein [Lacipirellula parvula]BBO34431.1 hypothetical protein PLANPX_4043 [Lacipirellula parvula]
MGVLNTLAPAQPTADQGAQRIKRMLAQTFQQVEVTLLQLRQISDRHGPTAISAALGGDAAEVAELYRSLKSVVEKHKQGVAIPDLTIKQ